MPVISDNGTVLLVDPAPSDVFAGVRPKEISPADIVGPYPADSFISTLELLGLRNARMALGAEVAAQDRARFPIPLSNLISGYCLDIFPSDTDTEEEVEAAWRELYERTMQKAAAELAVRRELREKRIGVCHT